MLKLHAQQEEWKDIFPGVRVLFRPITRKAWRAARRAAGKVLADGGGAEGGSDELIEEAGDEISLALLSRGIAAWEGVVDDDEQPVEPTPATIAIFLDDPIIFRACDQAYVVPFIHREREKNASSPSPNGTSAGEMRVAATASSAAPPKRARGVKRARTRSTSPRRKKAPSSGT